MEDDNIEYKSEHLGKEKPVVEECLPAVHEGLQSELEETFEEKMVRKRERILRISELMMCLREGCEYDIAQDRYGGSVEDV